MKKSMLAVGVILISIIAAATLFASDYGRGRGYMMWGEEGIKGGRPPLPPLWERLSLSEEQKAKISALREAHAKEVAPFREQMQSKGGELKLLWLQPDVNKDKILAVQKEIKALRDQMQEKTASHHVDVFSVLTPEQQAQVRTPGFGVRRGPGRSGAGMMGPGMGPGMGY